MNLVLLPVPRHVGFSDGCFSFEEESEIKKSLSIRVDNTAVPEEQGYKLTISPEEISITACDGRGAFYAEMTLRQIIRQCRVGKRIPCLQIRDYPDLPNRGVMLDISRDKVPTMQTLKGLIETLAEWKINQFQLYTEHTFAFQKHETVWKDASPMTPEEILELDAFCKERSIDLVPNQNSLGHFERWLKHEEYNHLAELPDDPVSLNPVDPGSIKLVEGLYEELLPNFSSGLLNVGCDEAFQLGKGGSRQAAEERGENQVYLEYLNQINELCRKHGRTMMFWGDMFYYRHKHPELVAKLPKDVIALVWGYVPGEIRERRVKIFAEAEIPYYVCPSTNTFNSIMGRTSCMVTNVDDCMENGLKHGAEGLVQTIWGDRGHWQQLPFEYPGLAYAAAASWCFSENRAMDLGRALDAHRFMDRSGTIGKMVCGLGETSLSPGVQTPFYWPIIAKIMANPDFPLEGEEWVGTFSEESLEKAMDEIDSLIAGFPDSQMECGDTEQIIAEIRNGAELAKHGYRLALIRLKTQSPSVADLPEAYRKELAVELEGIVSNYRKIWLARNRPGGLADSLKGLRSLLDSYGGVAAL